MGIAKLLVFCTYLSMQGSEMYEAEFLSMPITGQTD